MLETDALKEKLEMEIHRFARPPEELSSGDPYFEQLQTMLAIREELENIPLCDIQRDMLLAMENVLESAWLFRNTPVPDRCMNPNNISEVVYYFLQDKGAEYRGDLLYERAKAEFDARMEELAALPPKEILDHAYRSDAVWSTQTGLFFHPAATCPVLLHWRRNCLLAGGCGRCNLNKWRYQLEQEYFQKPDDHRCGLHPAGRSGLFWHHAPFQCGFEGPDRSGTGKSRGDSPWYLYHGGYG